ncbi:YsnF/AvaK domain-containing protein [Indioceanicola profundi]|uniref:YsnF/AvaK domain-containing protein n=1 Tax=Indioceanicola profundi TaxID=2220096 RepID=UPI000E6AB12E|nr:YsnF/AvaK domain-containing protein [Indioceanicola profundi]
MSDKTIVALYDDVTTANQVLSELDSAGLRRSFQVMGGAHAQSAADFGNDRGVFSSFGHDYDSPGKRVGTLTRLGVPQADAEAYAEGLRRGGVLLVGHVSSNHCDTAIEIVQRHGPVDIDDRLRSYRESGWSGYDASSEEYDATRATEERSRYGSGLSRAAASLRDTDRTSAGTATGNEEHIPIVEENVSVGKRAVEQGSVRVRSYIVETPIEEQVRLRDETITVERRAVTGASGDIPADAFRERTVEVTETDEEAVVAKQARVKEELVIRKDVEERAQTISDSVRHTEVEVDDNRGTAGRRTDR